MGVITSTVTGGGTGLTINQTVDETFKGTLGFAGSGSGTFSLVKTGAGTLTLTGVNTWAASTGVSSLTLTQGILKLDGSISGAGLALKTSGGSFVYDNTTSTGVKSQSFASLALGAGDSTIQSTVGGASNSTLTFTSVAVPAVSSKATVNFVTSGGINGVSNSIVLSGVSGGVTSGFLSQSMFFNGADYAYLDPSGFVRAVVYDTDAGFVNAGPSLIGGKNNQMSSTIATQGAVTVNTLKFSGTSPVDLGLTGNLILTNSGILRSGGGSTTISGTGTITGASSSSLVIRTDSAADNLTISSVITGNNGVVKSGAGTLILSGSNAYTGTTTVNAGTLLVNGSLNISSAVTVGASGVLGGTGKINGTLALASGGFIAPGVIGASGTLTGTSFTWNGGGTLNFDLGSGTTSDLLNLSGAFTKGTAGTFAFDFNDLGGVVASTTYTLVDFGSSNFSLSDFTASGLSGTFTLNGNNLQFTTSAVPEPGTWALLFLGAGVLFVSLRRRASA
jgi:autotransporter-associated beta strand protein